MAFRRPRTAFLTGITGQAGSYLAELLLERDYRVFGLCRYSSDLAATRHRIESIVDHPALTLHYGDLGDSGRLASLLRAIQPDEIYNLGAQSHVRVSFDQPELTFDVNATGTLRLLEAFRHNCPEARFYQASSSEIFGNSPAPQSETTPLDPRSPYAAAKAAAYWLCRNYREAYGLFICNGICFNHESPRRSPSFVTRKITRAVARAKPGRQFLLKLGNLEARRDWMHAKDAVRGMHLMLQHDRPDDYVLAGGEHRSVSEFLAEAIRAAGGLHPDDFQVVTDPQHLRPTEVNLLWGDYTKAFSVLGWRPEISFDQLVLEMVQSDIEMESRK